MPARKTSTRPRRRRRPLTNAQRDKSLKTALSAIYDLQKRVIKLERKERRKQIGFGAELNGIPFDEPVLEEIEGETIT